MANKLKFIFEYNNYISSIENSTPIDDLNISEKIDKYHLAEGLIHTYPLNKTKNILEKKFPELECAISNDGDNEIFISIKNPNYIDKYLPLINNLGYFISQAYDIQNDIWVKKFNPNMLTNNFDIEPKYDLEINPIPKKLYHTSPKKYENKILKIGLVPKSQSKLSYHPERIYLTDDINIAKNFSKYFLEQNEETNIYEIDTNNLNIKLYVDLNLKDGGFYTLSNIPIKNIKKIDTLQSI